jgi:ligand-binding sensor domain-containing protein
VRVGEPLPASLDEAEQAVGVWVGTSSGLVHLDDFGRRRYGVRDGLPDGQVRALHRDRSGTLWVATEGGLASLVDGTLSARPLGRGRWPTGVMALAMAPNSELWIATQDHGAFRWADGRLMPVTLPADARPTDSVFTDSRGRLWIVLRGGGIGLMDEAGDFRVLRRGDRFHRSDLAIHEDRDGTVWFGAGGRLTRFKDGRLAAITAANGLPQERWLRPQSNRVLFEAGVTVSRFNFGSWARRSTSATSIRAANSSTTTCRSTTPGSATASSASWGNNTAPAECMGRGRGR